ncbi:hypothetical protein RRG08_016382 [Elysia crispata]|uniref:Uncharacterized protein n=1 Tax=Elysia crispata TaxID=231223 RepID=A0AAE1E8S9_9GAST|nr:hypothetical protein RRG08_016382 [Elysia crispata]
MCKGDEFGGNWQESTEHLTEAINVLSRPGVEPSYYLLLFLTEKAKIQARLGKYDESLRVFMRARSLFGQIRTHALGEIFAVTETKLRETELITCVYETVPMIFKGNNALAKERLLTLVEVIEQEFPNSIELPTAHNQLGLSEQRGRSSAESTERAKARYLICLRLRTYFLKINPIPLYAPLNNVAMLCYRSNDLGQFYNLLEKALQISREFDWNHYYTGLSLVHLAEGSIGRGHFMSALLYLKEGERVLTLTAKDHDLRHRALLELAHVMVTLAPGSSHERSMQVGQQTDTCNPGLPRDGELVQSARGMCKQIAQDDLNKSAKYYLERLTELAKDMKGPTSPNKNIGEREQAISESSPLCQFAGLGSTHQPFIKQDISSTGATWSNSKKDGELSKCNREIPRFDLINSNFGSDGTNSLDMYVLCGQPIPQSGSSERNFRQEFHQSFNFAAPSSQSHERPCREPVEHTEPLDFLPREADEPVSSRRQPQEDEDQATGGDAGAELTFCHGNQLHVTLPFTRKAVENIWPTSPQIGVGCNDQCRNTDNNMDDNFEKISHFQQKDNILQQGLKELTLSRQLESSVDQSGSGFASSSGRGSMNRSTMDGTPSVFLDQPRDCDTHSVPNQIQGARPKTISNKKRSKSEHQ